MPDKKVRTCILSGGFNFRLEILDKIKGFLKKYELHLYSKDVVAEYIEQQVLNVNLFETTRLVVLDHIPSFGSGGVKSKKRLEEMLRCVPEGCVVVFNGIDKGKRNEWLFKIVNENGKVYESPKYLQKSSAVNHIEKAFKQNNKKYEDGCAETLVSIIGEVYKKGVEVDKIYLSLKKLFSFVGDIPAITKSDVIKTADHDKEYLMFTLFNCMDKRDFISCLRTYKKARDIVKSEYESAVQVLNSIRWRYRLLLFLKESKILGYEDDRTLQNISELKKLKRSGSGSYTVYELEKSEDKEAKEKAQYTAGMAKNSLVGNYSYEPSINKYSRKEIYNILLSVNESLFKVRSCYYSDAEIKLAVDNVLMTACSMLNTTILTSLRRSPHGV